MNYINVGPFSVQKRDSREPLLFESSKSMEVFFLLSPKELEEFFIQDSALQLFCIGRVFSEDQGHLLDKNYLDAYKDCFDKVFHEKEKFNSSWHQKLFVGVTKQQESLCIKEFSQGKYCLYTRLPVIFLQPYLFTVSEDKTRVFPGTVGAGGIWGGLQLSFPQMYRDENKSVINSVKENSANYQLFKMLRKWLRGKTRPLFLDHDSGKKIPTVLRSSEEGFLSMQSSNQQGNCSWSM
jgi:hypothetical protein